MAKFYSFFLTEWYSTSFFNPFICWTLRLFCILAIINNAAMNVGVHVSFQIHIFVLFGYIPRGGIAGYGSSIFSIFEEPPYYFKQWLYPFTFLSITYKGSLFSTSSPTFVVCSLVDDSHFDMCEVISHCDFLIFLFFRATPMAYGSSLARAQIGATAAGLFHRHSNAGSKLRLQLTPQLTAIPDP